MYNLVTKLNETNNIPPHNLYSTILWSNDLNNEAKH